MSPDDQTRPEHFSFITRFDIVLFAPCLGGVVEFVADESIPLFPADTGVAVAAARSG